MKGGALKGRGTDGDRTPSAGARRWLGLPAYTWGCLAALLAFQALAFYATRLLLPFLPVYSLAMPWEADIPFVPGWIYVYCLAFVQWFACGIFILSRDRMRAYRFTCAYALAMLISGAMFLAWPMRVDRPEVAGGGLSRALVRLIYSADEPNNLCPSLHVLASYFCWRGLWGCPGVPRWFKGLNLAFLVLVCMSVLYLKQHLAVDIVGGVAVAEFAIQATRRLRLERAALKVEMWLGKISGGGR